MTGRILPPWRGKVQGYVGKVPRGWHGACLYEEEGCDITISKMRGVTRQDRNQGILDEARMHKYT
jgi:hypothetical protein